MLDSDSDGICDAYEIEGCIQLSACNYDSTATDDNNSCIYPDPNYDCNGVCLSDIDSDGVCDSDEILGCTDSLYLEYDVSATDDNGSCATLIVEGCTDSLYTEYNALANTDDGSCATLIVEGCTDASALNFNELANTDDDSCIPVVLGCTDSTAFNYDSSANTDDDSCIPVVLGCTDSTAFNYDTSANTDDDSCIPVVLGCTDLTACNYNMDANTDDGSCYNLTVVIDTSSLTSVLTAIVSPLDSVVSYSWLYNGVEVGTESTFTASDNGVYTLQVSNATCDASASFDIQYVSVEELESVLISLYPNPVMDVLHIDLDADLFQIELQILNTMGAQIMTQTIDQKTVGSAIQIQVSDLPKGMYMLRVNSSNSSRSIPWIKM